MHLLAFMICSLLIAYGIAITVVEKRFTWPVKKINTNLRFFVHRFFPRGIRRNVKKLFHCAVCLSFWAALLSDIAVSIGSGFHYWMWPMTGFAAIGITWTIMTLFEVLEKK